MLFVLAGSTAGAQELVTNGGFDSGDFSGYTLSGCSTAPAGWDVAYGVSAGQFVTNPYAYFRCDNNQYTIMTQYLATTPGQLYNISFSGANTASNGAGNSTRILFGGTTVFDQALNTGSYTWTAFTTTGVATSESTALQFEIYNNPAQTFIDDISVSAATGTSTVPEPSSLALLASGLVGLVPVVRRSRRNG
jgi:hypothetical protein